eukprot:UC4_evm1s841
MYMDALTFLPPSHFFFSLHSIPESIGKDIEKACQGIYPLHDVFIRKVKILKKPKLDMQKLLELHGSSGTVKSSSGQTVKTGGFAEPAPLES